MKHWMDCAGLSVEFYIETFKSTMTLPVLYQLTHEIQAFTFKTSGVKGRFITRLYPDY